MKRCAQCQGKLGLGVRFRNSVEWPLVGRVTASGSVLLTVDRLQRPRITGRRLLLLCWNSLEAPSVWPIRGCTVLYRACVATPALSALSWLVVRAKTYQRATHRRIVAQARLAHLAKPKLLIIDELGYLPFEPNAAHLFFQLVSRRYGRERLRRWSDCGSRRRLPGRRSSA